MMGNCMNQTPYAYVYIHCIQDVRFPYYIKTQHQQGKRGETYRIRCMSYAELDYYRNMCEDMSELLVVAAVRKGDQDGFNQVIASDGLGPIPTDQIRNWVDGKTFDSTLEVRNHYDGGPY